MEEGFSTLVAAMVSTAVVSMMTMVAMVSVVTPMMAATASVTVGSFEFTLNGGFGLSLRHWGGVGEEGTKGKGKEEDLHSA